MRWSMTRTLLAAAVLAAVVLPACGGGSGGGNAFGGPSRNTPRPRSPSAPSFPSTTTSTSVVPSSTASGPSKAIALPTRDQRLHALAQQTAGERVDLVAVPGGYEAASYDQFGHIQFWHNDRDSSTWTSVGRSSYPYVPQIGPPHATVRGANLTGMQHATFIVYGTFTGDGSGNAVAFTTGANGWGAIKAEPNGNIGPSGAPVGADRIGLSYNFGFADGQLVTEDCPSNLPIYQCGSHPIVKRWAWTGTDFALA